MRLVRLSLNGVSVAMCDVTKSGRQSDNGIRRVNQEIGDLRERRECRWSEKQVRFRVWRGRSRSDLRN